MSDAAAKRESTPRVTELNVSGHLMTLDTGLFCIIQTPAKAPDAAAGLPGVRLSVPPGPAGRPEAITISSFRDDGWLTGGGDAALVRVANGPAQLMVTIYQAAPGPEGAPKLQVLRLLESAGAQPAAQPAPGQPASGQPASGQPAGQPAAQSGPGRRPAAEGAAPVVMDMVAHIQGRGDVGALLGDWLGERASKRWIEGFAIAPAQAVPPQDIEYQAVLGRGWLSPWAEGGQFCGSRGMALPVLGLRVRLRGASAQTHQCIYSATFTDGTESGPARAGEPCEAESLAPMEAFRIDIRPIAETLPRPAATPAKAAPAKATPAKATGKPAPTKPAAKPAAKPATGKGGRGR